MNGCCTMETSQVKESNQDRGPNCLQTKIVIVLRQTKIKPRKNMQIHNDFLQKNSNLKHRSLTKESLLTLVHAFVTSRVDHCNGLLFGSHSYLLDRLQSVLNSAARLVLNIPKFSHISAAIRDELHWLLIRRRIDFKIALMVRHCLVGAAPEYLMELCHPVGSAVGRQCLWSASRGDLVVPRFRLQTFGHRAFAVSGPQILELSSAQDQTIA